ncbi:hypothetical protein MUK42_33347, partial [Musa troglodytarum]
MIFSWLILMIRTKPKTLVHEECSITSIHQSHNRWILHRHNTYIILCMQDRMVRLVCLQPSRGHYSWELFAG